MSYAKFRPEKLKNKDQNEVGGADGDKCICIDTAFAFKIKLDQGFVNL